MSMQPSGNRHRQRSDGARTRSEILAQAAALASVRQHVGAPTAS
jgi:hypothetical protein